MAFFSLTLLAAIILLPFIIYTIVTAQLFKIVPKAMRITLSITLMLMVVQNISDLLPMVFSRMVPVEQLANLLTVTYYAENAASYLLLILLAIVFLQFKKLLLKANKML